MKLVVVTRETWYIRGRVNACLDGIVIVFADVPHIFLKTKLI